MADTTFQVTAGTGTHLHTITRTVGGNTAHDEAVALGLPFQPTYVFEQAATINTTTANSHMIQIMAGSTLNVYLHRITLRPIVLAGAATAVNFCLYRLTTAGTGGTAGSGIYAVDSTDAAAGATVMILPSSKGTEGNRLWSTRSVVPTALPATPGELTIFDLDFERLRTKPLRIPSGTANGIALKNIGALATATYEVEFLITELSY